MPLQQAVGFYVASLFAKLSHSNLIELQRPLGPLGRHSKQKVNLFL